MAKRVAAVFLVFLLAFTCVTGRIYSLAINGGVLVYAPYIGKRDIEVTIYKSRGVIYDCNGQPLTETAKGIRAVVDPRLLNTEDTEKLIKNSLHITEQRLRKLISEKRPFAADVKTKFDTERGIEFFDIKFRYDTPAIASTVIGYLDANGNGVDGVEKWYNDYLSENSTEFSGVFFSDASRRAVSGLGMNIQGKYEEKKSGVYLTLDKRIQKISQEAAEKYLKNGAILVSDVTSGEIKAMVSYPDYNPYDISKAVSDNSGALTNRALLGYNSGSCFKIVITAAALEKGIAENYSYNCVGYFDAGKNKISCYNKKGHGTVDMKKAFSLSCNSYFCNLAKQTGAEKVYYMAARLGFGTPSKLCNGMVSQAGKLPELKDLSVTAALANFAIGQGALLVTPVQMLGLSSTIANGGVYKPLTLFKGYADESGRLANTQKTAEGNQVIGADIASKIKSMMIDVVETGTGKLGKPMIGGAGAKTASAETGIVKDGKSILQTWTIGFFPANTPKYSICILYEDGETGGHSAAPVFKYIADSMIMQGIY